LIQIIKFKKRLSAFQIIKLVQLHHLLEIKTLNT